MLSTSTSLPLLRFRVYGLQRSTQSERRGNKRDSPLAGLSATAAARGYRPARRRGRVGRGPRAQPELCTPGCAINMNEGTGASRAPLECVCGFTGI